MAGRQYVVQDEFAPGQDEFFGEAAVLLDSQGAVRPAGIDPPLAAGSAGAARRVWHDDDPAPRRVFGRHVGAGAHDLGTDLVAGNARQCDQRVQSGEGREIAAAQADMAHVDQNLARAGQGFGNVVEGATLDAFDHQGLHGIHSAGPPIFSRKRGVAIQTTIDHTVRGRRRRCSALPGPIGTVWGGTRRPAPRFTEGRARRTARM